jgi:hypothetical protein
MPYKRIAQGFAAGFYGGIGYYPAFAQRPAKGR